MIPRSQFGDGARVLCHRPLARKEAAAVLVACCLASAKLCTAFQHVQAPLRCGAGVAVCGQPGSVWTWNPRQRAARSRLCRLADGDRAARGRRERTAESVRMQLQGAEEQRMPALQDYTPGGALQPVVAGMMLDELQRLEAQHSQATAAVGAGRGLGRTAGDWRRRQRILSAIAPIIIAGLTLTQYGLPGYAEFDPADRARPADEVMLDMQDMQEACSSGWEFNWRSSGKAIVCLEPDGCLWRKVDLKTNLPGRKWYDASFDKAAETYNVPFVNYLTRFIINFDPRWQDWWKLRQEALGLKSQAEASIQLQGELNRFAGSVEYGLAKYPGADGARRLLEELHLNYGEAGPEANRQLAIAFSLLAPHLQPVEGMQAILPSGAAKDAKQVALGYETKMRALAIETIKSPLLVDKGVRPAMLPADLPIIRTSDGQSVTFTLPGFERPAHGKESEDIFGARHPGGPVKRERRLEPAIYAAMSAAGLLCCSVMHLITVPVDVIKTRMQSPVFVNKYRGLRSGIQTLWAEEGWAGFTRGWTPTLVGFSYYGLTVYPGYEMFKRSFVAMAGEANDALYHVPLVLAAGAASTAIACLGVCPAEVTRIRMVSNPSYAETAAGVAKRIIKEEGFFKGLYEGFSFVLTRQVLFGMVKFLVFDTFASWVYSLVPVLSEKQLTQLLVSLLSGAVAGVIATVVSQPADVVLTRMKDNESLDAATVITQIWEKSGAGGFFAGLGSRCVWAGAIIAGQFLLYEVFKGVFQITGDDLMLFLDVIGSIELGSGMAGLRPGP